MKKYRKRKLKKKFVRLFYILLIVLVFSFIYSIYNSTIYIISCVFKDDKVIVEYETKEEDIYCILTKNNKSPSLSDKGWVKGDNNKCSINVEKNNNYKLYLKNDKRIIFKNIYDNVVYYKLKNEEKDYYFAKDVEYKIEYDYITIGKDIKISYSEYDSNIISIKDDTISSLTPGKSNVTITYGDIVKKLSINYSDLIVSMPDSFDFNKKMLKCDRYTNEENIILDEILKKRVEEAGYATRAGAVAAARFLTLEFPYRVDYFYENGRIAFRSKKVDGEGRYYHIGLYLSDSKTKEITDKSAGPAIWGCSMYNYPASRKMANGLDCSGFVSWALLNGGFDPGDIGAGITDVYDLTDTGQRKSLTYSLANSDTIKAGDLLWKNAGGGHIAIIVGVSDNNYFAAEALWDGFPEKGVIINKYPKSTIHNSFRYVILMDSYYKEDGNYTKLWFD